MPALFFLRKLCTLLAGLFLLPPCTRQQWQHGSQKTAGRGRSSAYTASKPVSTTAVCHRCFRTSVRTLRRSHSTRRYPVKDVFYIQVRIFGTWNVLKHILIISKHTGFFQEFFGYFFSSLIADN